MAERHPLIADAYYMAFMNDDDKYNEHLKIKKKECGCKSYIYPFDAILKKKSFLTNLPRTVMEYARYERDQMVKLRPEYPFDLEEMPMVKKPVNCYWYLYEGKLICKRACNDHIEDEVKKGEPVKVERVFRFMSRAKINYNSYGYILLLSPFIDPGEEFQCHYCRLKLGQCLTKKVSIYACNQCDKLVCFTCSKHVWLKKNESICRNCPAEDETVPCIVCGDNIDKTFVTYPVFNDVLDYHCRKCKAWQLGRPNCDIIQYQIRRSKISQEAKFHLMTILNEFNAVLDSTIDKTNAEREEGWYYDDEIPQRQATLEEMVGQILEELKLGNYSNVNIQQTTNGKPTNGPIPSEIMNQIPGLAQIQDNKTKTQ